MLMLVTGISQAKPQQYTETYTYKAGETESIQQARENAKNLARRQVLDRIGSYVKSQTKVEKFQVSQDEITSQTEGLVKNTWIY